MVAGENGFDVLLVDDDHDLLNVYLEILQFEGISASGASSGNEVLKKLPTIPNPKVILVDFMMPGLNGKALFQVLRDKVGERSGEIYAFSALDRNCELLNEVAPYVTGFIEKPADLMDFVQLVQDLLAHRPNRYIKPSSK